MNLHPTDGSRFASLVAVLLALACHAPPAAAEPPVPIIFDTDMGNDVDDALALAMLHTLESRGECKLLAVTVSKDNRLAAAFVDAIHRIYALRNPEKLAAWRDVK